MRVTYPSLKRLTALTFEDPRQNTDGKTIYAEKEGVLYRDGKVYNGSYVLYSDANLPSKYIAVHVSSDVNEESGENPVTVVAIDANRSSTINRMRYRARRSRKMSEA